jgi:hypothetical protein
MAAKELRLRSLSRIFSTLLLEAFKTKKQYDLMAPFSKVLDKGCIKLSGTSSQPSRRQISNQTIVKVTGDIDLSDANYTDIVFPDLATTDYNSTEGIDFISLMDSTSSFSLTACSDGNLYYQPKADNETLADYSCSTLFNQFRRGRCRRSWPHHALLQQHDEQVGSLLPPRF